MKRFSLIAVSACACLGWNGTPAAAWSAGPPVVPPQSFGRVPLHFEPNLGQSDPGVQFLARGTGYGLYLTRAEIVLALASPAGEGEPQALSRPRARRVEALASVVRMTFVGGNPEASAVAEEPLPGRSNYFVGSDPSLWRTDVPQYGRIRYAEIYPGTDVVFYGNQRQLEYDLVLKAGADPGRIRLRFVGVEGVRADEAGNLILATAGGAVVQKAPLVYQERDGRRQQVAGRYVVERNREVRFDVGKYDRRLALVIDPVLLYSTFLGGSGADGLRGLAVDSAGNIYVGGATNSTDYPPSGPYQGTFGGGTADVVVTKLNPSGSALIYSTYLGGSAEDSLQGLAIDGAGNVFITGWTKSPNFPTASPFQAALGGGFDVFVAKLGPSGSTLVYSTYFGGARDDFATGVATDAAGNLYATGGANSPAIPGVTPSLFSYSPGGPGTCINDPLPCDDAFVLKLNSSGAAVTYFTYLGGLDEEFGLTIVVDATGSAVVAGQTFSPGFPTQNALQPAIGGFSNGFVTKVNPSGSALVFSTYFGGAGEGSVSALAMDAVGSLYLAGTAVAGFPTTAGAFQATVGGMVDAFVAKLTASGQQLLVSTFLGGANRDFGSGVLADSLGNIYLTGQTRSSNFPTSNPTQTYGGGTCGTAPSTFPCPDAYVAKLSPDGSTLSFSTHLGGSGDDDGRRIALDPARNVVIAGGTQSPNFPTKNPFDAALSGTSDGFIAKLTTGLTFFSLDPCRLIDTREPDGPLAGPVLAPSQQRSFKVTGACAIPVTARAISVNLTVVGPSAPGFVTLFPGDGTLPSTSGINFSPGQVRANNGVFRLATTGVGTFNVANGSSGSTHVLIDVNGYFE